MDRLLSWESWDWQFVKGNRVLYYGEVASSIPQTTTDMGNGLWASNTNAATISSELYLNTHNAWMNANTIKIASSPNLYSVMSTSSDSMRYGGPGYISPISITVISPNGGEKWARGNTRTIRWTYSGSPGSYVQIELWKGGKYIATIISNKSIGSDGSGSYNWLIKSTQTLGTDYKVKIISKSNTKYSDTSNNNFTISAPVNY